MWLNKGWERKLIALGLVQDRLCVAIHDLDLNSPQLEQQELQRREMEHDWTRAGSLWYTCPKKICHPEKGADLYSYGNLYIRFQWDLWRD